MTPLDNAQKLLNEIRTRPALFWGGSEHPFSSLVAFLAGYKLGHEAASATGVVTPAELVPPGFSKFVAQKLDVKLPAGGKAWTSLIREKSTSDADAFELFFRLREEYESERPPLDTSGASQG